MTESFERDMSLAAGAQGVDLSSDTLRMLYKYYELLIERNNYVNLTAITDERDVIMRHFADSLGIVSAVPAEELKGLSLIDIGSGAGFPGMVLKIVFPGLRVTLLEATGKKADFLSEAAKIPGLTDIEILKGRAEELGHDPRYRERYDLAAARAVARLDTLAEYTLCFVRTGGRMIAYKGADSEEESDNARRAIETMGGGHITISEYELYYPPELPLYPGGEDAADPGGKDALCCMGSGGGSVIKRKIISAEKLSPTPDRYPRRTGVPSARPLR